MMKKRILIITAMILLIIGTIAALIFPYWRIYQLSELTGNGDFEIMAYTPIDATTDWEPQYKIVGAKYRNVVRATISRENNTLKFYYDVANEELLFDLFDVCHNYLSDGVGSIVLSAIEGNVGEIYISEKQLKDVGGDLKESKEGKSYIDAVLKAARAGSVRYCIKGPEQYRDMAKGMWYTLGENGYICLKDISDENVDLTVFLQVKKRKVQKIDIKYYEHSIMEQISMPTERVSDDVISIIESVVKWIG